MSQPMRLRQAKPEIEVPSRLSASCQYPPEKPEFCHREQIPLICNPAPCKGRRQGNCIGYSCAGDGAGGCVTAQIDRRREDRHIEGSPVVATTKLLTNNLASVQFDTVVCYSVDLPLPC